MAIREYFLSLFPFLLIAWAVFAFCRRTGIAKRPGLTGTAVLLTVAAFIAFFPFRGLSASDYILSPSPAYSIGSVIFFVAILSKDLFGRPLLSSRDFFLFCLWNVVLSICLFSAVLGFVGPDVYALGYGFSSFFIFMAAVTVLLAFLRSRLAFIFIAYIAAFDLGLLPSSNFFDYVTDGLLFIISSGVVIYYVVRKILNAPAGKPILGRIVGRE